MPFPCEMPPGVQADGVDHPGPIGINQCRCIIIRYIRWANKIGAQGSDAPAFPVKILNPIEFSTYLDQV